MRRRKKARQHQHDPDSPAATPDNRGDDAGGDDGQAPSEATDTAATGGAGRTSQELGGPSWRLYAGVFAVVFPVIVLLSVALVGLRLALIDPQPYRAAAQEAVTAFAGRDVTLRDIGLSVFNPLTRPALTIGTVTVPAGGGYDEPLVQAESVRIAYTWVDMLLGRLGPPAAIRVGDMTADLRWDGGGRASWQADGATAAETEVPKLPLGTALVVEGGAVAIHGPPGRTSLPLQSARLHANAVSMQGRPSWQATAALGNVEDGPAPVEVSLLLDSPAVLTAGTEGRVELTGSLAGHEASFRGRVDGWDRGAWPASFDGEFTLVGEDIAPLVRRVGLDGAPARSYRLSGEAARTTDGIRFDRLAARIGAGEIVGQARLAEQTTGAGMALTGELFAGTVHGDALARGWQDVFDGLPASGHSVDLEMPGSDLALGGVSVAETPTVTVTGGPGQPPRLEVTAEELDLVSAAAEWPPAWQETLASILPREPEAATAQCLAFAFDYAAGRVGVTAVLDLAGGDRLVGRGQLRESGPDLPIKHRAAAGGVAAGGSWHLGGQWDAPRLQDVPEPASGGGLGGTLAVPAGSDCTGALGLLDGGE